ncbi:MAG: multifunctional oxoglutarate decarboxylase/oxoglutarate dehydrogenase thiamine pyrophosphate-binding subunit/dihydrolipoyllysine-residue succinyltransferase subunit, partial [Bryobacteraceae bacterium]
MNSWLEDELYQQYRYDRQTVDPGWRNVFEPKGNTAPVHGDNGGGAQVNHAPAPVTVPLPVHAPGDRLQPLRGPALRIAENMTASLAMPVATSQRVIPVKVIEENRRLINQHRKISYTHLIAWSIVKALEKVPAINQAYAEEGGQSYRVAHDRVNLGVAVDVPGKDGSRALKVPCVKNAHSMDFAQFIAAYDDLVSRARENKLAVSDFEGSTISLTNPGTVGTMGSNPRLMPGQGAIVATGAIDYPPEYRGVPDDVRTSLGLSKVMTVTCTYDHRVIQGAESGMFLGRLQALLEGEDGFYDQIFRDLGITARPLRWEPDHAPAPAVNSDPMKQAAVARLIQAWRERGHLLADLDPLGSTRPPRADLEPSAHGLTIWDLDRTFHAGSFGLTTLRALMDRLRSTYAGKMGVQYMHIEDPEERSWLEQRMEPTANQWDIDPAARRRILKNLIDAEGFETFLDNRFKGHKRFSLEGGESMVAMLDELLERAAASGVQECMVGMSHRGRLSVLANIVGKSMAQLFSEFEGAIAPESFEGQGDVKYHLGASGVRRTSSGKDITVSLAFNPSHLEAVNPVVEGLTRPKQDRLGDETRERVIPLLIHGDAAMAGQGVVPETINLSQVDGYDTGGTVHIVVNNQIGFTTNPEEGRSTTYCSDIALGFGVPVFHVNADEPEGCIRATQLAYDYRQRFHKDVVIDLVCYRKYGHNEADDPSYTQPILYRKIRARKPVAQLYAARLGQEGVLRADEAQGWHDAQKKQLEENFEQARRHKEEFEVQELSAIPLEAIPMDRLPEAASRAALEHIVDRITTFPEDFHLHPKLGGFIRKRREALAGANAAHIDWALAEVLAFGSLVLDGTPVRLSGEDSARGTFSQRHAAYRDYEDDRLYVPLQHLATSPEFPRQARFDVYNSPLSEFAVMGFEFGYSVADPLSLVVWEAQFGDFANGAQVIIDQFIAAAESKWGQPSGLVLLLPHGQEGQGPEHSSARLERYLQLCGENNLRVANCTTPAQYFHLLRRQMHGGPDRRGLRKPLIAMTPKSLLRHPKAGSSIEELTGGVFEPVLDDATVSDAAAIRKILVCSGKIYYDLLAARDERKNSDTAIVRIEQLYPFPEGEFAQVLAHYPAAGEVVWVQEEPRNMGAWGFVRGWIQPTIEAQHRRIGYAGRPESASTAPGSLKRHMQEQASLI